VVAIGGGYGTLSEIALALRIGRPVVGLKTWVFGRSGSAPDDGVRRVESAEEAVRLVLRLAREEAT
jgi:predicted Rossmann-fold nucleotide-binding protein